MDLVPLACDDDGSMACVQYAYTLCCRMGTELTILLVWLRVVIIHIWHVFLYAPRPAHIMRYVSGRVVRRLTLSLLLLFFPYMFLNCLFNQSSTVNAG